MPKSVSSYYSGIHSSRDGQDDDEDNDQGLTFDCARLRPNTAASSSVFSGRTTRTNHPSEDDLHVDTAPGALADERTSLLGSGGRLSRNYMSNPSSVPATPRSLLGRQSSYAASARMNRNHSRRGSFSKRLVSALASEDRMPESSMYTTLKACHAGSMGIRKDIC